ncbi:MULTISPECIES: hypothetical protein [Nostoc]|uniref:Uncharacterized protein n=1 Tax=Nostoc paludosum FACHB-159 TaxID=2692908 RepID=A0ABR8K9I5_9NOSO|nr:MULTISPECIES: hypothetical protein [Nostoc]MBD2734802.1 hypothetical protein [Nostoc paludosum FACHB-159]
MCDCPLLRIAAQFLGIGQAGSVGGVGGVGGVGKNLSPLSPHISPSPQSPVPSSQSLSITCWQQRYIGGFWLQFFH